jgi:hypothetical protein
MANIKVSAVPSNTTVTVQDGNNITANIQGGNNINVTVTPTPKQVIQINRGVSGGGGSTNTIGGYPVTITDAQRYDVLMFGVGEWVNTPQTEVTDGGNF